MIKVNFRTDSAYRKLVEQHRLKEAAHKTLVHESFPGRAELTLVITSDEKLRALNFQYRGVDKPTDVLAFGDDEAEAAPDEMFYLGDVIIAYPRAEAHAQAAGHSTADELVLLVIHGALHLLGHDHATQSDKHKMWSAQEDVLRQMNARVTLTEQ